MKILRTCKIFIYYFLIFLCFFIAGIYAYYKYKIPKNPNIRSDLYDLYPKDIILKTGGYLRLPKKIIHQFLNFPSKKEKGTIRIGTFGDSHTQGSEVEKIATYPHYLQKLFDINYPNHPIEILNFGVEGRGFSEQFFLWEKYAKAYQLDYILLGPRGFQNNRNTRFVKFSNWPFPKNRFILTNNGVKEVHIEGNTIKERFYNYYTLIPSWTALRYDKQPFKLYELLFPFLSYKIENPFYYAKLSEQEEAITINKFLLEKVNKIYPKKILFFTNSEYTYSSYKNEKEFRDLYNLNLIKPPTPKSFYTVFDHESSLGNELTAQFYFNALLGKTQFFTKIIRCYFEKNKEFLAQSNSEFKNLDGVSLIKIMGGGGRLLFNMRINYYDPRFVDKNKIHAKLKKKNPKSFLSFLNLDGSDFLRSVYIPTSIQLKEGMKLYIEFKNKNRMELGSIQALDAYNKFFVLYSDYIYTEPSGPNVLSLYLSHKILKSSLQKQKAGILFVENYHLGKIIRDIKRLKLIPKEGYGDTFLMTGPERSIKIGDFPEKFPVYMNYETTSGKNFKSLIPDWSCRKENQNIHLNLPHFEPLNL